METDNKKELAKALFYTNTAYLLGDVLNTYFMEIESSLRKIGKGINHQEKYKLGLALQAVRTARIRTADFAKPMYGITEVNEACTDSDYMSDVIKLVVDRTQATEEGMALVLDTLKRLPSVAGLYDILQEKPSNLQGDCF